MAGKLTARGVRHLAKPGRHSDGDNLYLNVSATGSKSWVFMYRFGGKLREIGLGSIRDVTLAEARKIAAGHQHRLKHEGIEPERKRAVEKPTAATFADVARQAIEDRRRSKWKSERHAKGWTRTLDQHAAALMGLPVDRIDTEAVLGVLKPIWNSRQETAKKVRNRIELVLAVAAVMGLRDRDAPNPARWKNHLELLLPVRPKTAKTHLAAMPFTDVPGFLERLRERGGIAPLALEFAILTGGRTAEALGATWNEIDLQAGIWTIPKERMKAGRAHRVPLSRRAVEILERMSVDRGKYVFHGYARNSKLAAGMMLQCLRHVGVSATEACVHGFRSSFRNWAGKQKQWPREWAEISLAHTVGSATEQSYWRDDLLEERREMMEAWSAYCTAPGANVVRLRAG